MITIEERICVKTSQINVQKLDQKKKKPKKTLNWIGIYSAVSRCVIGVQYESQKEKRVRQKTHWGKYWTKPIQNDENLNEQI